jgi:HEAT repeat protein
MSWFREDSPANTQGRHIMYRILFLGMAGLLLGHCCCTLSHAAQDKQARIQLKQLLADLKGEDEEFKLDAIIELAEWGPEAAVAIPELIAAIRSRNEDFRLNAAITLGKIGQKAVPELAKLLASDDADTRYYAVAALSWIGPHAKETVGAVVKLLADKDDGVRCKAVYALPRIAAGAKLAVPVLIAAMDDKNEDARAAAVEALARFGKESVPALLAVLLGKDQAKARQAAAALGAIGADAKDAIGKLQPWLIGGDNDNRTVAAETLAKIGAASIPTLVKATRDNNPATRMAAVDALNQIGATAAADLLDALGSQHADVRRQAALRLAQMRISDKMVVLGLAYALRDADEMVRYYAAEGLQQLGSQAKPAAPKLKEALIDLNFNVRQTAWYALANIDENPQPLLKKYLSDKNARLRINAAGLLAVNADDKEAQAVLRAGLKEKDLELRLQAAVALAMSGQGSKQATAVLMEGLKSPSAAVRVQAIQGLQTSGDHGAAAAPLLLDILLHDPDQNLRPQARYALQCVGGDAKVMLPALQKMLEDPKSETRRLALETVWRWGAEAIPLIVKCSTDKDEDVRYQVIAALRNIQGDLKSALPQIKALLKDKSNHIRWNALALLNRCGEAGVQELLVLLGDNSDDNVRWAAVQMLWNMKDHNKKTAETLTGLTKKENPMAVRTSAAYALARMGNEALPALLDVIKTGQDPEVRAAAMQGFYRFDKVSKEMVSLLIDSLKDKSALVRWSAAYGLLAMGDGAKQALPHLAMALRDENADVRLHAFRALSSMTPDSLPALLSNLNMADSAMRQMTLDLLSQGNSTKEMVPGLIACLKDTNAKVRQDACKLLGQLGKDAKDAAGPLREMVANDRSARVRTAAQTALDAIVERR